MQLVFHSWALCFSVALFYSCCLTAPLDALVSWWIPCSPFSDFSQCDTSARGPTLSHQFCIFFFPFSPRHPGRVWISPERKCADNFPMGKKGLFQRQSGIQPPRQKIAAAWKDTSEKWDPPQISQDVDGCPSRRPPSPSAVPMYLRLSLDSRNSYQL